MLSKIAIKRPVTTVMIILMVAMAGIISYFNLDLAYMPTMDIPVAIVSTTYVGAGPEEIEEMVTKPIEEVLATVTNVDSVQSTSSNSSSLVIVQFVDGTDLDIASIDIREKVDMVKGSLPAAINDPIVMKIDINAQPITVGITSDELDLSTLNNLIEEKISKNFERIAGVAAVDISGGIEKEVEIVLLPEKMKGYGITTQQISQVLASENINLPAGTIQQGTSKLQIKAVGQFENLDEIRKLPIQTGAGSVISISDVANVGEVIKERDSYSLINSKQGIVLSIDKQSIANIVDVSDRIEDEINSLQQAYPELEITLLTSTAQHITTSVNNVLMTAITSAIIAVLVLFIFLGDIKTSLIIGVSIPTSIMAAFGLMYLKGMSMNTISMGGIVIGIGMLVDNSVVVLENIDTYWAQGYSAKEASEKGTREVAMAVLGSTLTTVAVFLPLIFMPGMMGALLQDLALAICFSLAASYVVAITFVPMASSLVLKREESSEKGLVGKLLDQWLGVLDGLDRIYRKMLSWALRNKKKTVAISILMFIGSLSVVPLTGLELMPSTDEGTATITVELPSGSILEEVEGAVAMVLDKIEGIEEIEMVYATIGAGQLTGSANQANVTLNLVKKKDRNRSTEEVSDEIRGLLADVAGADITVSPSGVAMGPVGGGTDLSVNITGLELDKLKEVSEEIMADIAAIPGAKEITSSSEATVPEATVVINRNKASQYGISTSAVADAINTAVTGSVATQYKRDGTEIDIRIRHDKSKVNYINDIKNITINTVTGSVIPITEVADIIIEQSAETISRTNSQRYILIEANVDGKDQGTFQNEVKEKLDSYLFPEGYGYEFAGTMEQMDDTFKDLAIVLIVAVLLVYMIMASQFESLIHPFIIMFSMPIAITGGVLGLFVMGMPISVTAFMGFIMLVGMVVNNGIVLVDYTNQLIANKGISSVEALEEAGPSRLRPILMTTMTTVVGLIPMAIGTGEGMETQRPLAVGVIFGLLLSTVITLVFIPVLYESVEQFRFRNRKKKRKTHKSFKGSEQTLE